MSRKGDCWDNAVAESFFASIKKEFVHDVHFKTRQEARDKIFGNRSGSHEPGTLRQLGARSGFADEGRGGQSTVCSVDGCGEVFEWAAAQEAKGGDCGEHALDV